MGNSLEKSSASNPLLTHVEFNEPFTAADRQLLYGNIDEAWEEYLHVYKEDNEQHSESLVNLMIGLWRECYSRLTCHNEDEFGPENPVDVFSCLKCCGLLYEPCTLSCGHSLCRKCIGKPENFVVCVLCKEPSQLASWPTKLNVTLAAIINKWFPAATEASKLRLQGNSYFCKKNYKKSIAKYSEGLEINPSDHLLLGNRSNVYMIVGDLEKALADADRACRLKPRWPKAHYRRAMALSALERFQEASTELLKCILLDSTKISVRKCLEKSLHEMLLQEAKRPDSSQKTKSNEIHSSIAKLNFKSCNIAVTQVPPSLDQSKMKIDSEKATESQSDLNTVEHCEKTKEELAPEASCMVNNPLRLIVESFSARSSFNDDDNKEDAEYSTASFRDQIGEEKIKAVLDELECPLCCRTLYEPTITPCGHTFCKACLSRSLDHSPACPFCRFSLFEFISVRQKKTTEVVQSLLQLFLDVELREREKLASEEKENMAKVATDTVGDIPVLVCTLALPTLPCPLHIFEPRYRLMLRQCIESGSQQFGMAMYDDEKGFSDFGCMVEIRSVNYLNDGRALVDTIGGRRFKVKSRDFRDGYRTAKVEWIYDKVSSELDIENYRKLNREVYAEAKAWFQGLSSFVQGRITGSFGSFPECCDDPEKSNSGPKWTWWLLQLIIDSPSVQLSYLASSTPMERLQNIRQRLNSFS